MKEFRDFVGYSFKYFIIVISITILLFALEAPVGSIIGIVLVMLFVSVHHLFNEWKKRKETRRTYSETCFDYGSNRNRSNSSGYSDYSDSGGGDCGGGDGGCD